DHHMVVIHDRLVERTTNGKGAVADLTLEQLRNLDAGYHFTTDGVTYPYRGKGIRIPTLDEILTLFPRQRFLIELKDSDFAAAPELVAILQRHDAFRRVVVELISLKQRFAPWLRRLDNRMIVSHTAREIALFMALSRL